MSARRRRRRRSRRPPVAEPPERPTVAFTNLDKVFWPADGYTKGDMIAYYEGIAEWLLPYLKDRPVVLTRYPDGIDGKSFFQKDAPVYAPSWLRLETMWSEHAEREIRYFVSTTSSRCSTSPTWARFRCTSGRAASRRSSGPTGAFSISTRRARR